MAMLFLNTTTYYMYLPVYNKSCIADWTRTVLVNKRHSVLVSNPADVFIFLTIICLFKLQNYFNLSLLISAICTIDSVIIISIYYYIQYKNYCCIKIYNHAHQLLAFQGYLSIEYVVGPSFFFFICFNTLCLIFF